VADGWYWFVLREKYCWLVVGGWFVLREKYCWLVADKPSEQGAYESDHCSSQEAPYFGTSALLTIEVSVSQSQFHTAGIFKREASETWQMAKYIRPHATA
jgi:hypothetical protein